jgi:hypothetical protein
MSRYRTIDIRMHGDEVIASLSRPQPNARSLWDHLLYGPSTGVVPGLYRARAVQLADELEWLPEPFLESFDELSTARFRLGLSGYLVKADWRAGLIWVPNAVRYNAPRNPNVIVHWAAPFDELPECELKIEAYHSLADYCKTRGAEFVRAFERLPKPFRRQLLKSTQSKPRNQDQDQDQDQEQDQEQEQQQPPARAPTRTLARALDAPGPGGAAAAATLAITPMPEREADQAFTPDAMSKLFAETYFALRKAPANLRGDVSALHAEVIATAKARGIEPRGLFRSVVHRWALGELNEREAKHPYACFAAAFGQLVQQHNGRATDPRSELQRQSMEALKRNDLEAYARFERELSELAQEQQHAQ